MNDLEYWWGRVFPQIPYQFRNVRDWLIVEHGLTRPQIDRLPTREVTGMLVREYLGPDE